MKAVVVGRAAYRVSHQGVLFYIVFSYNAYNDDVVFQALCSLLRNKWCVSSLLL